MVAVAASVAIAVGGACVVMAGFHPLAACDHAGQPARPTVDAATMIRRVMRWLSSSRVRWSCVRSWSSFWVSTRF